MRDGSDRSGWLVGVDRQISDHFEASPGYNFTDASGDLTQLDYDYWVGSSTSPAITESRQRSFA